MLVSIDTSTEKPLPLGKGEFTIDANVMFVMAVVRKAVKEVRVSNE